MTMTIIDEDGIHTVGEDENVMCPTCHATNSAVRKRCYNCNSLMKNKVDVITTKY